MQLHSELAHPRRFIFATLAVAVLGGALGVVSTMAVLRTHAFHRYALHGEAHVACFERASPGARASRVHPSPPR